MQTDLAPNATPIDTPLPAEFPLGIAAACFAMGFVFAVSPVRDGPVISGVLMAATAVGVVVSIMIARSNAAKNHG
jgi:hypothetical protein